MRRAVVVIQAPGLRRDAVARPGRDRGGEGVLQRVLGQAEVADLADERREDRRAFLAEGPAIAASVIGLAQPWSKTMTGRTSTEP